MNGEKIVGGLSSKENVSNKHEWVKEQVKAELAGLKGSIFFYETYSENSEKIKYNMDVVKSYLRKLSDEVKNKTSKEAWSYLTHWRHQYAWVMAVQIALESLSKEYDTDVDKIDWLLWGPNSHTRNAVRKFQEKWNKDHKKQLLVPDWLPGKATINALLEVIGWPVKNPDEEVEEDGWPVKNPDEEVVENSYDKVTVTTEALDVPTDGNSIKAEDFLENVPNWATVEFEGEWLNNWAIGKQALSQYRSSAVRYRTLTAWR